MHTNAQITSAREKDIFQYREEREPLRVSSTKKKDIFQWAARGCTFSLPIATILFNKQDTQSLS